MFLNLRMEIIFTLKDIESTGYKSWTDFYLKITSWSGIDGTYTYGYTSLNGEKAEIQLKLPIGIIESLFLEEVRIVLLQVNVTSFSELLEKYQPKKGQFEFNVIVRAKTGEVFFKKIIFWENHVIKLCEIENKKRDYTVYDPPRFNNSPRCP